MIRVALALAAAFVMAAPTTAEDAKKRMTYQELLKGKNIDRAKLPKVDVAIEGRGTFTLELVPDLAPETCMQILRLVDEGF
ncbi:MAG: hypothetical protein H0W86_00540 [Armatimonadetes bacterium]|nr:hypothetical protein [Armatimonadota bacterium]